MANSLRFSVEVSADQASEALKALSVAANQAGVNMRTSLLSVGPSAKQASNGLKEFKESAGRARETAMFFTQALGELGPQGRTAQIALSGIAGALIGGGGVVAALALAQTAARLVADVWEADAKAAEEFRKKSAELAKQIAGDTAKTTTALFKAQYILSGGSGATFDQAQGPREALEQYRKINEELYFVTAKLEDKAYWESQWRFTDERPALREKQSLLQKNLESARLLVQLKAAEAEAAAQVSSAEETSKAQKSRIDDIVREDTEAARVHLKMVQDEHDQLVDSEIAYQQLMTSIANEEEKKRQKEAEDSAAKRKRDIQESIALQQQYGAAIGETLGKIVTGQETASQALAQIGQMVIQQVIKTAIASITAKAAEAGAGAAASQAGIPVVGPVLAVAAMGAVMSQVLGLLGSMPSARGGWWDTGSYEGLAVIHQKEMVLPAREAEMVRRGAGGVTINVAAYDGRGFDRVLGNNSSALNRTLRQMGRKGTL